MLLELTDVAAEVSGRTLFTGISGRLRAADRIALTGPNGIGKTTLLRMVAGELPLAGGLIRLADGVRLGYLRQDLELGERGTLWEYAVAAGGDEVRELERRLRRLEVEMAEDPSKMDAYGRTLTAYEQKGGYAWEARVRQHLRGVGFTAAEEALPLMGLSGGQKVRLALARLLLEAPDVLLLDEPTNHLDLASLAWLEETLIGQKGGILFVSHDRAFLRRVATQVWDFSPLGFQVYPGGYEAYRRHLKAALEQREAEAGRVQQEREKLEAYVRKYKEGNRATQAHDRERKLSRLKSVQMPQSERRLHLELRGAPAGERQMFLQVLGLSKAYGERTLWRDLRLVLPEGGRLGIVGSNGSGKTTLLRALAGEIAPDDGEVLWAIGAHLGYLRQEVRIEGETPLDALLRLRGQTIYTARRLLARHLFTGEQIETPIAALSGGERSRLALAVLVAQGANVLLLDEPTNHLDLPAQEELEAALAAFRGTVLLVSHDRALLQSAVDRWLVLEEGGGWSLVRDWQHVLSAPQAAEAAPVQKAGRALEAPQRPRRLERAERAQQRQELSHAEQAIAALEAERAALEEALQEAFDPGRSEQQARRYSAVLEELEGQYARWAEISEQVESQSGKD